MTAYDKEQDITLQDLGNRLSKLEKIVYSTFTQGLILLIVVLKDIYV